MYRLQCQASQPHFRVWSLPEKTSVARLRLEKVYDLRLKYARMTVSIPPESLKNPIIYICCSIVVLASCSADEGSKSAWVAVFLG